MKTRNVAELADYIILSGVPGGALWFVAPLTVMLFAFGGYTVSGVGGLAVGRVTGVVWSGVVALVAWILGRTTRLQAILSSASPRGHGPRWCSSRPADAWLRPVRTRRCNDWSRRRNAGTSSSSGFTWR